MDIKLNQQYISFKGMILIYEKKNKYINDVNVL